MQAGEALRLARIVARQVLLDGRADLRFTGGFLQLLLQGGGLGVGVGLVAQGAEGIGQWLEAFGRCGVGLALEP